VESFGVGAHVKLPGSNARESNVYPFGTPYQAIYEDLKQKVLHIRPLQEKKRSVCGKEGLQLGVWGCVCGGLNLGVWVWVAVCVCGVWSHVTYPHSCSYCYNDGRGSSYFGEPV